MVSLARDAVAPPARPGPWQRFRMRWNARADLAKETLQNLEKLEDQSLEHVAGGYNKTTIC